MWRRTTEEQAVGGRGQRLTSVLDQISVASSPRDLKGWMLYGVWYVGVKLTPKIITADLFERHEGLEWQMQKCNESKIDYYD